MKLIDFCGPPAIMHNSCGPWQSIGSPTLL